MREGLRNEGCARPRKGQAVRRCACRVERGDKVAPFSASRPRSWALKAEAGPAGTLSREADWSRSNRRRGKGRRREVGGGGERRRKKKMEKKKEKEKEEKGRKEMSSGSLGFKNPEFIPFSKFRNKFLFLMQIGSCF